MARDQRRDVEFAGGVEAAKILGELLTQQPVGADHGGLAPARTFSPRRDRAPAGGRRSRRRHRCRGGRTAGRDRRAPSLPDRTRGSAASAPDGLRRRSAPAALRASRSGRATAGGRVRASRAGLQAAIGLQMRQQARQAGAWLQERGNSRLWDRGRDLPLELVLRAGHARSRVARRIASMPRRPIQHGSDYRIMTMSWCGALRDKRALATRLGIALENPLQSLRGRAA